MAEQVSPVLPTFETALKTVVENECLAIGTQRGQEYGDSWSLDNVITTFTRATLKRFGIELAPEQLRLLIAAAVVDLKDQRVNAGPWKHDNIVDGINYRALYAYFRDEYESHTSLA